ncbi:MAG TPA: outer membrane beta-barrel domain-containing protein [Anaeromyxobacteraceae bacterium]|nr:outer membrane beta-barrel domain-containing protein [Anaeromyxobacteraceae bacterium]
MRAPIRPITWLLVALPLTVYGQEMPGLDLSAPPKAKPKPAAPAPAQKPGAAEPGTPLEKAVGVPGEADGALEDRVKAVQRKGFIKQNRLQLTAFGAAGVNDAFFQKLGVGGMIGYNIEDSFAVALRGAYWYSVKAQAVKEGAIAFQSQLLSSGLSGTAMLDGIWSPVYGKFAWLGRSIVHFDAYVIAGAGLAWSASSGPPRNEGPHVAGDLGAGIRFYPNDWLCLDLGLVGTFYADQKDTALPGDIQKVVALTLGVSFFVPTRFEYYYP